MKSAHLFIAVLLAGCASAKDDPNAKILNGRVVDMRIERPPENYTYTPPSTYGGVAGQAAANVAMNDSLRRPICIYTIRLDDGSNLQHSDRGCAFGKNACVRAWVSTKTPRPVIESRACPPEEGSTPKAG